MTNLATDTEAERRTMRSAARLIRTVVEELVASKVINPLEEGSTNVTHSVYVLRLKPSVWDCKTCAEKLRGTNGSPAFYIGYTSIPVVDRIRQHMSGIHSSHMVREHFAQRAKRLEPKNLACESLEGRLTRAEALFLELEVLPHILRWHGLGAYSR
jgi:ribosomal protein L37AE/L43A